MDVYKDALGLMKLPGIKWEEYRKEEKKKPKLREQPPAIRRREAARQKTLANKKKNSKKKDPSSTLTKSIVAGIKGFTSWDACPIELNVVINKDVYEDKHEEEWVLITTMDFESPQIIRKYYSKRPAIEERHRQLKCFWDLTDFHSCAFSLVVNQIIFILLAYTLLQVHLLRIARAELNNLTLPRLTQQLLPGDNQIVIYYNNHFAFFTAIEHQKMVLTLEEHARKKILKKTCRIEKELIEFPYNNYPP